MATVGAFREADRKGSLKVKLGGHTSCSELKGTLIMDLLWELTSVQLWAVYQARALTRLCDSSSKVQFVKPFVQGLIPGPSSD